MVEVLRNKWCEELEDILQCPICMTCPTNTLIYQCTEGHHICQYCRQKCRLDRCPTCSKNLTNYRNRLAENLCSKFDDIKVSLIDPEDEINKLLISDKICVATQTDNVEGATAGATAIAAPASAKEVSDGHSGPYPCCVGACEVKMCFEPLIEHIKSEHSLHFLELPLGNDLLFHYTWFFHYIEETLLDRVFHIRDLGTFIVKLSIDKCGDFTAFVMMLHNGFVSKQFSYQLKISGGGEESCPTYLGNVNSCRSPITTFGEKCLKVKSADMRKMNENAKMLKCTLNLARKLQLGEAQLPKVNVHKKRLKNRNKTVKAPAVNIQNTAMPRTVS